MQSTERKEALVVGARRFLSVKFVGLKIIQNSRAFLSSGLHELGANVRGVPPNHLVGPIPCRTVAGNVQHELVRNFDIPKAAQPDASVGRINHQAKKHPAAGRRLQFCHTFERIAQRLALVLELFGLGQRHVYPLPGSD